MYNEIIPDNLADELLAIRDSITSQSFRIGDIVIQIAASNQTFGIMQIYSAVGMFAGKASRTVREYAAVATMYSLDIRREFEVLAFDHFRGAMKLGNRWYEALVWAVKETDSMNRPATVDAMLAKFDNPTAENFSGNVPDPENDSPGGRILKSLNSIRATMRTVDMPEDLIRRIEDLLGEIEKALNLRESVLQ